MKRNMFVVLLLVVCLGVLVVEGVSQPTPPADSAPVPFGQPLSSPPQAPPPPTALSPANPKPNFSAVQPQQQEWSFEQLVEALKGVRARQKDLQTQEADLLAKMAKKVEEKRQDLSKSEATLQQLQSENGRIYPSKHIADQKLEGKK